MIVEFKFDIGDIVDWLNPHDIKKEIKRGRVNSLVYQSTLFIPKPRKRYYVSFVLDEKVICEEEDLTFVSHGE